MQARTIDTRIVELRLSQEGKYARTKQSARGDVFIYSGSGDVRAGLGRKGLGVEHHVRRQPSDGEMMTPKTMTPSALRSAIARVT